MARVIIVDDDRTIVRGLQVLLGRLECNLEVVGEAHDGIEGYEKVTLLKPDIVFTDILMPGMTGLEMYEKLQQADVSVELVLLSAHAEFEYAQKACRLGASDYLLKPVEPEHLLDVTERLVEKVELLSGNDPPSHDRSVQLPETHNRTVNLIRQFIQENYSEEVKLYHVAEHFNFNANYISQLFRREVGVSYSRYVNLVRLKEARKLLKFTSLPIKDICCRVGIDDYFYFNRLYKKFNGITPFQERQE